MKRFCFPLIAFLLLPCAALAAPAARILAALYDSQWESTPRPSQIHRFLEMPANHLGYDIHYYDISAPLPKLGPDVAGIVIWFDIGTEVPDANAYLAWLEEAMAQGKKLILIENSGLSDKDLANGELFKRWNHLLSRIGLQDDSRWNQVTYGAHVSYIDKEMVGFERKITPPLPPLTGMHILPGSAATSHLRVALHRGEDEIFDLVITSPQGGYIAPGYAMFGEDSDLAAVTWSQDAIFLWYVNPFIFLKKSLDVQLAPVPDVTTLDGKRIFYSHLDGDGWNNVSEIPSYQARAAISAEVIYNEILKPYSDFAFNVGLITADVDPDCYGVEDSERIARKIFALPNVEPSSHTYSHPLFWEFFANYDPELEKPYLHRYPPRPGVEFSLTEAIRSKLYGAAWPTTKHPDSKPEPKKAMAAARVAVKRGRNEESVQYILEKYYDTPRSYACSPFNLEQEIIGSAERINQLTPKGKKVKLLQWSGDTSPFEAAIAMTRKAGLLNINGGDSRFDKEYPSYSSVAPIGIEIGNERQIYSSNSNEDTYTNLWKDRFFGYRYLQTTAKNTESPIRVSPFNIYFHIFSGEKQASLNAIKENLEYARKQDIIRITATQYASIAEGFYSAGITRVGENSWSIRNRGSLQTFRFDAPGNLDVDFGSSQGVIGERFFQNSLYVALDPAVDNALIALKKNDTGEYLSAERVPYLIDSTWQISNVRRTEHDKKLTFDVQGYGRGIMVWKVPAKGDYLIKTKQKQGAGTDSSEKRVRVAEDGILSVTIDPVAAMEPLTITIQEL